MDPIGSDRVQKKGVNWIVNCEKGGQLDWGVNHNEGSIRSSLAVWGVWGCWKGHPIRLKISKTRVITAEPPYHAQVWEYPPPRIYILYLWPLPQITGQLMCITIASQVWYSPTLVPVNMYNKAIVNTHILFLWLKKCACVLLSV